MTTTKTPTKAPTIEKIGQRHYARGDWPKEIQYILRRQGVYDAERGEYWTGSQTTLGSWRNVLGGYMRSKAIADEQAATAPPVRLPPLRRPPRTRLCKEETEGAPTTGAIPFEDWILGGGGR